jgi:hypothetical protein
MQTAADIRTTTATTTGTAADICTTEIAAANNDFARDILKLQL